MRKLLVLAALLVFAVPASATTSRILAPMDWWPVPRPTARTSRSRGSSRTTWSSTRSTFARTARCASPRAPGQLTPSWSGDGSQLAYAAGGLLWHRERRRHRQAPLRRARRRRSRPRGGRVWRSSPT